MFDGTINNTEVFNPDIDSYEVDINYSNSDDDTEGNVK